MRPSMSYEQTLAKRRGGNPHLLDAELLEHGAEDGHPSGKNRPTIGVERRKLELVEPARGDHGLLELCEPFGGDGAVRPACLVENVGNGANRARSAVGAIPASGAQRHFDRLKLEAGGELGFVEAFASDFAVAEELLREADAAHVHAVHGDRLEGVADDELGAPAADVHDEAPRGGARNAVRDAEVNQARLFTTGDDLDVMAESLPGLAQELAGVAGLAKRVGSDRPDLLGAEVPEPLTEEREALDRAILRLLIERAVVLEARSQSDRLANAIDDLETTVIDPRNHHVKAVRPQVYCSK